MALDSLFVFLTSFSRSRDLCFVSFPFLDSTRGLAAFPVSSLRFLLGILAAFNASRARQRLLGHAFCLFC